MKIIYNDITSKLPHMLIHPYIQWALEPRVITV